MYENIINFIGIKIVISFGIQERNLQLIEIVQLALVGFAAIILIIFFVSYAGYKTSKKAKNNSLIDKESLITSDSESLDTVLSDDNEEKTIPIPQKSKPQKFQVFNPGLSQKQLSNNKKHFPRTLFIKK